MRNPLPLAVERTIGVGLLLGVLCLWWGSLLARAKEQSAADVKIAAAKSDARLAHEQEDWWQAKYRIASDSIGRLNATVGRLLTADAGDTIWRRDTVMVHGEPRIAIPLASLARLDTTRRACGQLAASVVPLTTSCDSSLAASHREAAAEHAWGLGWQEKYEATHQRWYDRIGVDAGYGITKVGSQIVAGPQLGVAVQVWPWH